MQTTYAIEPVICDPAGQFQPAAETEAESFLLIEIDDDGIRSVLDVCDSRADAQEYIDEQAA